MVKLICLAFVVVLAAGAAATHAQSPLNFPAEAVSFGRPGNLKQTILFRPLEGEGPFPAVVLVPACGGAGDHIYDWAERLTRAGYVVLIVDSLTPRGVSDNCLPAWQAR